MVPVLVTSDWAPRLGDADARAVTTSARCGPRARARPGNRGSRPADARTGPDKDILIGANFKPFYAMDRGVDLTSPVNAMVGGAALVAGVGDLTIEIGDLSMGGMVWGSLLVVILHPVMRWLRAARRA